MCQNNPQKQKILIVDDSEINRSILADILGEEYEIFEAADGVEAIEMIEEHVLEISAVLLDIVMPRMDGFGVLTVMNQRGWIEDIPVIIISAESGSKQVEQAYNMGATDFIQRPFDALIVHRRVVNTVLLYTKQRKLLSLVAEQIDEKERLSNIMVDVLSHIVEFRNGESGQHIVHIRTFTEVILRQLQRMTDRYSLTKADIDQISLAASLHDIGKIAIDEKILNKPGRLTPEEFEIMKTHSAVGAQMLENLPDYQDTNLVRTAWEICRWHHERYDGRGYPDGLKGDAIPISAQVIALADVYDALISDRCYKKAYPHEKAIQMILNGECGVFNPLLLDCLRQVEGILDTEFIHIQMQQRKITRSSMVKEMLKGENAFASERSLYLLDQERMKFGVFSGITDEIQFEYTAADNALRISEWDAKKLGIDAVLPDPVHNETLLRVLGENVCRDIDKKILDCQEETTIHYECPIYINGQPRWHRLTIQIQWQDGECTGVIGKAVDIHDSWMQINLLKQKVDFDAATGLLNHISAKEKIQRRMEEGPEKEYGLVIFDLDKFKSVNDTYGHIFGDRVLQSVADRVRQNIRENNIVARIGGDEFLIFSEYLEDSEARLQRIFDAIVGDYEGIHISVSMGIARSSVVGNEYDALFHAADQALYFAKRAGRGRLVYYNDSMKETLLTVFPTAKKK